MTRKVMIWLTLFFGWIVFTGLVAKATDLRITIPPRSESTPVQRLNRKGVDALRRNALEKARALFYHAYLLDPDDPFTLNNLGVMAELEGQVDRAQRFYALAQAHVTEATVGKASVPEVEGETFRSVITGQQSAALEINRSNFDAIQMLSEQRASEAEALLQKTLKLDFENPFTLNNLGVAKEMQGDYESAQHYYLASAGLHSKEIVMVSSKGDSRGKPVSEIAAANAKRLDERLLTESSAKARAGRLNLQGVQALNRNEWQEAGKDFLKAYEIDPSSAFSINNLGYLFEINGDLETARIYYDRVRSNKGSNARVGLATRSSAEGMKLGVVARQSSEDAETKIQQRREDRRRQEGPILLRHRDGTPVVEPEHPSQSPPNASDSR